MDLANWGLRTSPKFTTGVKIISFIRVFDQIRDPEIPITLRPLIIYIYINVDVSKKLSIGKVQKGRISISVNRDMR